MKDDVVDQFQNKVSELLVRHRSILDSLSKFQQSGSRANRAIIKAVTNCGCLSVCASRQSCPPEADLKECKQYMESHVKGELCEQCRETVEEELGNHLFYLAAVCHLLNLDLVDVFDREFKKITTLGVFHLS